MIISDNTLYANKVIRLLGRKHTWNAGNKWVNGSKYFTCHFEIIQIICNSGKELVMRGRMMSVMCGLVWCLSFPLIAIGQKAGGICGGGVWGGALKARTWIAEKSDTTHWIITVKITRAPHPQPLIYQQGAGAVRQQYPWLQGWGAAPECHNTPTHTLSNHRNTLPNQRNLKHARYTVKS